MKGEDKPIQISERLFHSANMEKDSPWSEIKQQNPTRQETPLIGILTERRQMDIDDSPGNYKLEVELNNCAIVTFNYSIIK
ncbi:hypothetical protein SNE35_05760 [Paucibacter sp. R3-3]|uniref:Uncharacterized protein n=1 Tax=Roseateles agri TaxID=3098619 RepID=A0ABU5DCI9_9BURK|nr:hypothetical protein [Paucibacter sp. R3-3]MDY0743998.1 hypothetical protein [Paucibacter sp. R3-3]